MRVILNFGALPLDPQVAEVGVAETAEGVVADAAQAPRQRPAALATVKSQAQVELAALDAARA